MVLILCVVVTIIVIFLYTENMTYGVLLQIEVMMGKYDF